jgi:predicted transcriptional regulator
MKTQFPLTPLKASFAKHLVMERGWSQTKAAIRLELNQGSVSRAVNGVRHPNVPPIDPDTYKQAS